VPAGATATDLVDDPTLADAMIARALDTGATVVVLPEDARRALADDVAALLRY
jgi:2-keto-3-deoxy-L-rhamnonate aldolase RhmA